MSFANRLILRIKRSDSLFFRTIKKTIRFISQPTLPRIFPALRPPLRLVYDLHFFIILIYRSLITVCYRNPLFQARCTIFGRHVSMDSLPFVSGHVQIFVGDNCYFGGNVSILSGAVFDDPKLTVSDRSAVGWNTIISVNKEVFIEEDVIVSYDCRISDTDGHRRETDLRAAGVPPDPADVKPVRICRYAFIGNGTHIMKGVTIGEGATVASNSVVISNIPPYSLALGNPAEVYLRNYGRPSNSQRKKSAPKPEA